ncbi:MAG: hypothetical protein OXH52_23255 [Gammaproteobacteria bacterium]|nr:hypothetical protein [Gammaproteobacteria bacterium]
MTEEEFPVLPPKGDLAEAAPPQAVALAREIVEVERAKIAVEAKAIEASDSQDKRMAEFHSQRIRLDDAADQRRIKLANRMLIGIASVVAIPLALILLMAFWGDETQRGIAMSILTTGGIAIAGFGIIHAGSRGIRTLLARRR